MSSPGRKPFPPCSSHVSSQELDSVATSGRVYLKTHFVSVQCRHLVAKLVMADEQQQCWHGTRCDQETHAPCPLETSQQSLSACPSGDANSSPLTVVKEEIQAAMGCCLIFLPLLQLTPFLPHPSGTCWSWVFCRLSVSGWYPQTTLLL